MIVVVAVALEENGMENVITINSRVYVICSAVAAFGGLMMVGWRCWLCAICAVISELEIIWCNGILYSISLLLEMKVIEGEYVMVAY